MIIRPARKEDATAVLAIQNPIIRDTAVTFTSLEKTEAEIVAAIAAAPCFLVAEDDAGRVAGFVSYDQFRKGPGYARTMEHSIVLAPDARGQGTGRLLIEAALDRARRTGVGSMWAGVSGENAAGLAFHARAGFEEVARLPSVGFKFGRWMDLILMRKWLGDAGDASD
ncbi:phosphinothricin acetyltransferase [Silicimonas algicola]|uniref:Phosphinothricin acetyltransferase n=1 Tax=Silicimonas algicola TaxID=1826607 RepID=A0A316GCH6_9RHOB|nr:phosphinothricin acetyltransferase [Silicimonas algicola]